MRLKRPRPHTRAARTAASKPPASAPTRTPELSTASAGPPARRERSGAAREGASTPPELRLFAVATPGLEPVVAAELQALPGARQLVTVPGGVEFTGDLAALYRANLWLRSASRVLLRLAELRALHFASLRRQVAQLPWERFAPSPVRVTVAATAHRCRLYHSTAVAERIALGIADRGIEVLPADSPRAAPELHLIARGTDDLFTISLDTSGELLHRRGYRSEDAGAPLRETLAAALLQLCEWDGSTPLLDPTCGSGTLVIEAALLAFRITTRDIGTPGGNESDMPKKFSRTLRPAGWVESRIQGDLLVRMQEYDELFLPNGKVKKVKRSESTPRMIENFIDGHKIDTKLLPEGSDDLLRLILAHQAVIDEDAG